ncbi:hypothetical protein FBQ97_07360 [Acidobacteria bacterium ACD]|nr:MAG: hypothetical protein EDX89_01100 [Acidobacteriota bacterium]MCE7958612.1 hypothetical protein [Acidobacteria bacterium ACB2]MDL1949616.1 hypothetical protein [Acidobacteria bacterium ACD]
MSGRIALATWESLVGKPFRIHAGPDREVHVSLAEVADLGRRERPGGALDCYALRFVCPEPGHLPQATYRLAGPEVGALDVFLVPIGPGPSGMLYEAIFN